MPDWLIWGAIAALVLIWRGSRRGARHAGPLQLDCCSGAGRRRLGREHGGADVRQRLVEGRADRLAAGEAAPTAAGLGAARRESPLKALQRRFVAGAISLEQYEAELDRLDRLD